MVIYFKSFYNKVMDIINFVKQFSSSTTDTQS